MCQTPEMRETRTNITYCEDTYSATHQHDDALLMGFFPVNTCINPTGKLLLVLLIVYGLPFWLRCALRQVVEMYPWSWSRALRCTFISLSTWPLNLFVGQALTFKVLWTCMAIKEWVSKCLCRELAHKIYRNWLKTLPDCSMELLLTLLFIEGMCW